MRMMPMPPGPGGVAMAAIVSSALLAGGICSKELTLSIVWCILLFFCSCRPFFSGRSFSAFTAGAIDQHLFKKALSHTPAADFLVILQGKVNNAAF